MPRAVDAMKKRRIYEEKFEVDRILERALRGGQVELLTSWVGYSSDGDTFTKNLWRGHTTPAAGSVWAELGARPSAGWLRFYT